MWTNSRVFLCFKTHLFGACKPKVPKEAICTNKSPLNSHPISRKTFVLHVNWKCCAPGNLRAINQTAAELHILHFTGDWDILNKKCGDKMDWSLGGNDHGHGALCEGLQSVFRCQRSQRWSQVFLTADGIKRKLNHLCNITFKKNIYLKYVNSTLLICSCLYL